MWKTFLVNGLLPMTSMTQLEHESADVAIPDMNWYTVGPPSYKMVFKHH